MGILSIERNIMKVHGILKPLMFVSEVFCVAQFAVDSNKTYFRRFRRSVFYHFRMMIFLIIIAGTIIYRQTALPMYNFKNTIGNVVEFAHYNCRLIGTVSCVLLTNFHTKPTVDYLNKLNAIEKRAKEIGFEVDYSKISPLRHAVAVLAAKIVAMQIPFAFAPSFFTDQANVLNFVIFSLPLLLVQILSLQWVSYLLLLKAQFASLDAALKTARYNHYWVVDDFKAASAARPNLLGECSKLHGMLCSAGRHLNDAFSWQFLAVLPGFFIEIVLRSFYICQGVNEGGLLEFVNVVSDVVHFVVILEVVLPSVYAKEEAEKVMGNLVKIGAAGTDCHPEMDDMISLFTLQAYHQRIEFSVKGVFILDGALIYSILGGLVTYLIILLQFDIQT